MRRQFSNKEILENATFLHKIFLDSSKEIVLPVKANFYLQKNLKLFLELAQEIEEAKLEIGARYGEYQAETESYMITDSEKLMQAHEELKTLFSLTQMLELYTISLEDLEDSKLTTAEMNALLFMIEE